MLYAFQYFRFVHSPECISLISLTIDQQRFPPPVLDGFAPSSFYIIFAGTRRIGIECKYSKNNNLKKKIITLLSKICIDLRYRDGRPAGVPPRSGTLTGYRGTPLDGSRPYALALRLCFTGNKPI